MRDREKYENGLFTLRFTGEGLSEHGVSIYDFASTLLALQRIINKALAWRRAAADHERTGSERSGAIARREGIPDVTGQKSAEAIVVAALLTRKVQRRAEHEEKGGAMANSIWPLNPTG